jgi:hypothetical protein
VLADIMKRFVPEGNQAGPYTPTATINRERAMKKRWVFLIACFSLAAGFIAGGYAGINASTRLRLQFDEFALENRLMADATTRLMILKSLRDSHEDQAIQVLEVRLAGDIVEMDGITDTSNQKKKLIDTLSAIHSYRAKINYHSPSPQVASIVQHAFERAAAPAEGSADK